MTLFCHFSAPVSHPAIWFELALLHTKTIVAPSPSNFVNEKTQTSNILITCFEDFCQQ